VVLELQATRLTNQTGNGYVQRNSDGRAIEQRRWEREKNSERERERERAPADKESGAGDGGPEDPVKGHRPPRVMERTKKRDRLAGNRTNRKRGDDEREEAEQNRPSGIATGGEVRRANERAERRKGEGRWKRATEKSGNDVRKRETESLVVQDGAAAVSRAAAGPFAAALVHPRCIYEMTVLLYRAAMSSMVMLLFLYECLSFWYSSLRCDRCSTRLSVARGGGRKFCAFSSQIERSSK